MKKRGKEGLFAIDEGDNLGLDVKHNVVVDVAKEEDQSIYMLFLLYKDEHVYRLGKGGNKAHCFKSRPGERIIGVRAREGEEYRVSKMRGDQVLWSMEYWPMPKEDWGWTGPVIRSHPLEHEDFLWEMSDEEFEKYLLDNLEEKEGVMKEPTMEWEELTYS